MHPTIFVIALLAGGGSAPSPVPPTAAAAVSSGSTLEVVGLQSVESLTFHSDLVAIARPIEAKVMGGDGQFGAAGVTRLGGRGRSCFSHLDFTCPKV